MNTSAGFDWWNFHLINLVSGMINFITGLISLGWVGMWMGLTTKRPNIAVAKAFVFVQVIPWFALMILQIFISFGMARTGRFSMSVSTIVISALWICKDIGFILWARSKLYSNLREVASSGKVAKSPTAAASPSDAPPVIAHPA
jgi:hypothetical protein